MDAVSFFMEISGENRKVTYDNFDLDHLIFIDGEFEGEVFQTASGWKINNPDLAPYASAIMKQVDKLKSKFSLDLSNLIEFVAWTKLEVDTTLVIGVEKSISFEGFSEILTVHMEAINYQLKGPIKLLKA